ncbi:MAG TPA: PLDc N-terminal domain-containing protein [Longimicrobiales bacterium]|nr:PLDc N-terminal domain-containing protein [Longimicrobiales bacterium]
MRPGLALFVFIVNIAAIVSILGSRRGGGRKLAWVAGVVLAPVAGAAAWALAGRRRVARRTAGTRGARRRNDR